MNPLQSVIESFQMVGTVFAVVAVLGVFVWAALRSVTR